VNSSPGFSVHYPTCETVQRGMLDSHASLTATVQQTEPGCTAAATAFPAWSTSAVVGRLRAAHAANVNAHALEIAGYAIRLQLSLDNYRNADSLTEGSIDAVSIAEDS
jgi:hypothetical protein